jgi:uncharacterized protein with von Willebrand factor type A (vWA) domain
VEAIGLDSSEQEFERLFENVLLFARLLRRAGMTVGTGQILDLARALPAIDIGNRDDFYHTARVILVGRREDLPVFDTLFNVFWTSRTANILKDRASTRRSPSSVSDVVDDCIPDSGGIEEAVPRIVEMAQEGD